MVATEGMYWETYADQTDDDGYTYIGVANNIEDLIDVNRQVSEFRRKYGRNCDIRLYRRCV